MVGKTGGRMKVHVFLYGDYIIEGELAQSVEVLDKFVSVKRDGYGRDAKFIPQDKDFEFDLIKDEQLVRDEERTIEYYKKRAEEAEKSRDKYSMEKYDADKKAKELEKQLQDLKDTIAGCGLEKELTNDND